MGDGYLHDSPLVDCIHSSINPVLFTNEHNSRGSSMKTQVGGWHDRDLNAQQIRSDVWVLWLVTILLSFQPSVMWQCLAVSIRMDQPLLVLNGYLNGTSPMKLGFEHLRTTTSLWHDHGLDYEPNFTSWQRHQVRLAAIGMPGQINQRVRDSSWVNQSKWSFQAGYGSVLRPIQWLWCLLPNINYPQYGPSTETSQCFHGATWITTRWGWIHDYKRTYRNNKLSFIIHNL